LRKSRFLCILATDRQTDEQMDSSEALSRSRCRKRGLNKKPVGDEFAASTIIACLEEPRGKLYIPKNYKHSKLH